LEARLHESQRQLLGFSLVAAGVVIPIIIGTASVSSQADADRSAVVLLALPIVYWGMAVAYFSYGKHSTVTDRYLESVAQELNTIVSSSISPESRPIFRWASFLRSEWNRGLASKILISLWPAGEITIIALPGLGSLLGFFYILRSANLLWQDYYTILLIFDIILIIFAATMGVLAAADLISHREHERASPEKDSSQQ